MKKAVANLLVLLSISAVIVVGFYFFNIWFEARWQEVWFYELGIPLHHAFFLEGIFSLCGGIMLLLGAGGLNAYTVRTILTASIADWVYKRESDEERVQPSDILYADRRRPRLIFPRAALVLIIAGVTMILFYFMTYFVTQ